MYPKKFWDEFRLKKYLDEIFVGMWFDEENVRQRFNNIILKAIEQTGLKPCFLKEIITGDSIPIDIMKGIIECKLVLFEISPVLSAEGTVIRNANVMYELGLAHTWRNPEEVIIIRDDGDELPFDIQSMGVVRYKIKEIGNSIEQIKNTILFRLNQVEKIQESSVRKAAESLNIQAYNLLVVSKGKIFHDATLKDTDKILAIPLLLNLGLIELLTDGHGYGYHPTYLGKKVISYFGQPLEEDDIKNYKTLYKEDY